jgi:hypothetical protein
MDSNNDGISRRNLLKAAAAGAVVGIPAVVFMANNIGDSGSEAAMTSTTYGANGNGAAMRSQQPVVAYVRDVSKGEIVVMQGMTEAVITDKKLAAQLLGVVEG